MIDRATLRLVLLVSCAHALVHVYELALPSVEQEIARTYFPGGTKADEASGKALTGWLSTCWRLPWGLCALAAGWLVDRFGSRRMLVIYLLGCAAMCVLTALSVSKVTLFAAMISMGMFASIYHPAGLSLISHATTPVTRPRALGIHGIMGSVGIGVAPLLAWLFVGVAGFSWPSYYWALAVPGVVLGVLFLFRRSLDTEASRHSHEKDDAPSDEERADWRSYFTVVTLALLQGFIYSAMMSFLPRYLSGWEPETLGSVGLAPGKAMAAGVLLVGCVGQYLAGRFAKPDRIEFQLMSVTFGNVPFLMWMAVAGGWSRLLSAALFALVHFMHQPLYNCLIAKYTPRRRRSLCYGFSFAMGLGFGSFGAVFAGRFQSDFVVYGTLGLVAIAGGCVGLLLWRFNRRSADSPESV